MAGSVERTQHASGLSFRVISSVRRVRSFGRRRERTSLAASGQAAVKPGLVRSRKTSLATSARVSVPLMKAITSRPVISSIAPVNFQLFGVLEEHADVAQSPVLVQRRERSRSTGVRVCSRKQMIASAPLLSRDLLEQ
jgi:hypothetical protein